MKEVKQEDKKTIKQLCTEDRMRMLANHLIDKMLEDFKTNKSLLNKLNASV